MNDLLWWAKWKSETDNRRSHVGLSTLTLQTVGKDFIIMMRTPARWKRSNMTQAHCTHWHWLDNQFSVNFRIMQQIPNHWIKRHIGGNWNLKTTFHHRFEGNLIESAQLQGLVQSERYQPKWTFQTVGWIFTYSYPFQNYADTLSLNLNMTCKRGLI